MHTLLSWDRLLNVQTRGVCGVHVELLCLHIHSKREHEVVKTVQKSWISDNQLGTWEINHFANVHMFF